MSRYIDVEPFENALMAVQKRSDVISIAEVLNTLMKYPAADVAEVRHGRWIKKYRGNYLCSVCGAWYRTKDDYGNIIDGEMTANYCESCGAKMDEVLT